MYDPTDTKPTTKVTTFSRGLIDQREGRKLTLPKAKIILPDRANRRLGKDGRPYDARAEQARELTPVDTTPVYTAPVKVAKFKKKTLKQKLFGK